MAFLFLKRNRTATDHAPATPAPKAAPAPKPAPATAPKAPETASSIDFAALALNPLNRSAMARAIAKHGGRPRKTISEKPLVPAVVL